MNLVTTILIGLVIVECGFIFVIETIIPQSKLTSQIFKIPVSNLQNEYVNVLLKNQGVYNLLLAPLLLVGLITGSKLICSMILIYLILVAAYGSLTSQKKIIVTQGGLPLLSLLALICLK